MDSIFCILASKARWNVCVCASLADDPDFVRDVSQVGRNDPFLVQIVDLIKKVFPLSAKI